MTRSPIATPAARSLFPSPIPERSPAEAPGARAECNGRDGARDSSALELARARLPAGRVVEPRELVAVGRDGDEMIAGALAQLEAEVDAAIADQDLGLAAARGHSLMRYSCRQRRHCPDIEW